MIKKIHGLENKYGGDDPVDFAAIESLDEFKDLVTGATVISFIDTSKNKYAGGVIFGREVLLAIASEVVPPQQMASLTFAVDCSETCADMEKLFVFVEAAKGYYEWDEPQGDKRKPVGSKPAKAKIGTRLFHYTRASNLIKILLDQEIKQATALVDASEKPAAWFSYRQDWEPSATPGYQPNDAPAGTRRDSSFEEMQQIDTPARIQITPAGAPVNWRQWRKQSGVKHKIFKALEKRNLEIGASVDDWQASFEPVKSNDWLAIEVFVRGEWRDHKEYFADTPSGGDPKIN